MGCVRRGRRERRTCDAMGKFVVPSVLPTQPQRGERFLPAIGGQRVGIGCWLRIEKLAELTKKPPATRASPQKRNKRPNVLLHLVKSRTYRRRNKLMERVAMPLAIEKLIDSAE